MTQSDSVLFFFNTNFTQIIHFYIYKLHKALADNGICPMFTKSNTPSTIMVGETEIEKGVTERQVFAIIS